MVEDPLERALEDGDPALWEPMLDPLCELDMPLLEDGLLVEDWPDELEDVSGVLLVCATAHRPEHIKATAVRINFRILGSFGTLDRCTDYEAAKWSAPPLTRTAGAKVGCPG